MEDLFGVASSCDKFRVSLPGADAFSAFKGDYGCHYSIERPFKVFVGIRHWPMLLSQPRRVSWRAVTAEDQVRRHSDLTERSRLRIEHQADAERLSFSTLRAIQEGNSSSLPPSTNRSRSAGYRSKSMRPGVHTDHVLPPSRLTLSVIIAFSPV
jgi:hypothetical protein